MIEVVFPFPLENGLHARPAGALTEEVARFDCRIRFKNGRTGASVNARSILELMGTDTRPGDPCRLVMEGPDAPSALKHFQAWLAGPFTRLDDDLKPPPAGERRLPAPLRRSGERVLAGTPASEGTALAPLFHLGVPEWPKETSESGPFNGAEEERRLEEARRRLDLELTRQVDGAERDAQRGILAAHRSILSDPVFLEKISQVLRREACSAARAVRRAALEAEASLQNSENPLLRERALDVRDVAGRLVALLGGAPPALPSLPPHPVIAVVGALTPAGFLFLDRGRLAGIALETGGAASHTAILARSFGIPCAAGLGREVRSLPGDLEAILDGTRGLLVPEPSNVSRRWYASEARKAWAVTERRATRMEEPGRTRDGARIGVLANAGLVEEALAGFTMGAEGIGLFRTEFLFLEGGEPPSEDHQFEVYERVMRAAGKREVVFRTADLGGDKPPRWLHLLHEDNPQLGCRGVRLYPLNEELLRVQVRAILRAARLGRARLMIPMVSSIEEVRWVRRVVGEERERLAARSVATGEAPLGIMVEVPSAAMQAEALAAEADFFSVGTNDLLQYFTAADRGNPAVGSLYSPLHPAFLRLLRITVDEARSVRRRITICGEAAGDGSASSPHGWAGI